MRSALLIGKSNLLSCNSELFLIWSCGVCGALFHTTEGKMFKEAKCPICNIDVKLDKFPKK